MGRINVAALMMEAFGTFFFVLTINSVHALVPMHMNALSAPFAIGFSRVLLTFIGGHVSGAHYNPANTLALLISAKVDWLHAIIYVGIHTAAAFCSGWLVYGLFDHTYAPGPGPLFKWYHAFVVELLWSFIEASAATHTLQVQSH